MLRQLDGHDVALEILHALAFELAPRQHLLRIRMVLELMPVRYIHFLDLSLLFDFKTFEEGRSRRVCIIRVL